MAGLSELDTSELKSSKLKTSYFAENGMKMRNCRLLENGRRR